MREIIQRVSENPKYARLVHWGKLISLTGSAQIVVQAFALVSGILIIRILPTRQYAYYTLVNIMLGTMAVLADSGIGDGVLSQGGKVWKDRLKLGAVMATGLDLRRKFAIGALVFALPTLTYMLIHQGCSIYMAIILIVSLIPSFFVALSGSILEMAPKLHQDILPLQKNQVSLNIIRLILICSTLFFFPLAFVAVLGACIPQIWANLRLRKISSAYADYTQKPDPTVRKAMLKIVRRTMPGGIYFCFSSQVTTWIVSLRGSTENLARVGALNRLAVVLTVFTAIFSTLVIPRFARLQYDKKLLLKRFMQIQGLLFLISALIVFFVFLFPHLTLSVLGHKYQSLTKEVVIVMISGCFNMIYGVCYNTTLSRGWVIHPAVMIGVNIMTQLILAFTLNLNILENVFWFAAINSLVTMLMVQIYFITKIWKTPEAGLDISIPSA